MPDEKPEVELARLKKGQEKARKDEVFGGLSESEKRQYEIRAKRIRMIQSNAVAMSDIAETAQQRAWAQTSETDSPQLQARQPCRSREKNSSQVYADSKENLREVKRKDETE